MCHSAQPILQWFPDVSGIDHHPRHEHLLECDHFPFSARLVEFSYFFDVVRRLELGRVDKEERLRHTGVQLLAHGVHPWVKCNPASADVIDSDRE